MSEVQKKRGSELPQMPSFEGATEKIIVFGIRWDTGETVNFPLSELIRALNEGEIIPKLADNLNIGSSVDVSYTQTRAIETTGGDQDINSERKARVVSVRGTEAGILASGAKIVSVGFNQLPPSGIDGQVATFKAVRSAWGEYGKSTENNGYLFTDEENHIVVPTSVKQGGNNVPTHTESGVVYYLPANDGEVVATFAAGVDVTKICAHLCWSNYRDNENAAYSYDEINLASVITSMGGTMRRVSKGSGYAYDEIVFGDKAANRIWYRRIGVATPKDLNWSVEEITTGEAGEESTTYRFAAAVTGIKSNGIFSVSGGSVSGFTLNGTNLIVESDSISTVAALKTALTGASMKFELATPVTGTHNLTGLLTVDDFGTIRFEGGATSVEFVTEYASRWADVVKNLPNLIEEEGATAATAIVALAKRISGIEKALSEGLPQLTVESLTVRREFSGLPTKGNMILKGTGAPQVAPEFVGQTYLDTTNKKEYRAFGLTIDSWELIN